MQLDELVREIEGCFGPVEVSPSTPQGEAFERYLEDQVNRRIIREFLANAIVLGHLPAPALRALADVLSCPRRRDVLALHMLMSAVEDAAELLEHSHRFELVPLPDLTEVPHLTLVKR